MPRRVLHSGAQKRRRAYEKRAKLRADLEVRAAELGYRIIDRAQAAMIARGTSNDDSLDVFTNLGPPPLDDVDTGLRWVRRAQLVATELALSGQLTEELRERLRFLKDMSAVIGMTHSRASQETRIKKIEAALRDTRRLRSSAKIVAGKDIAPAPNSRGVRRPPTVVKNPDDNVQPGPRPFAPEDKDKE